MKTQNCILHILWLIFLLLAVSCAPSRDKKNTLELSFWGSPEEVKIVNRSMKDFKERHPDVRVNATHIPAQGYLEKILTRAAADNLPDIMFMEVGFIDQFVDKNMVKDLTPLIKADKDYSIKDYFPKILNRFTFGDRIYGLPRDVAPFACIYYNKNMLKQAGLEMPADDWTLRKFVEYGKKLTREKKGKKQWGFFCWAWGNFLYTFGGRYVDNNKNPTKAVINSTETRKAINFYKDLMYKHKMMPMPGSVDINQAQAFMTGQVAMYLSGIWESPAFREIHDFDWDVVMFPRHPDGSLGLQTGGSGYAMARTTKHKKLAWELLKTISGKKGQVQLARLGLAQPALKSLAYSKIWAKDTNSKPYNKGMLNQAVKHIIFNPRLTTWSEVDQKINEIMDMIVRNKLTMDSGLQQMEKIINKHIKENS